MSWLHMYVSNGMRKIPRIYCTQYDTDIGTDKVEFH